MRPAHSGNDRAGGPPSPKKRKATSNLDKEFILKDDKVKRITDAQGDISEARGMLGQLLFEFSQIELNRDLLEAIKRTESKTGAREVDGLPLPLLARRGCGIELRAFGCRAHPHCTPSPCDARCRCRHVLTWHAGRLGRAASSSALDRLSFEQVVAEASELLQTQLSTVEAYTDRSAQRSAILRAYAVQVS